MRSDAQSEHREALLDEERKRQLRREKRWRLAADARHTPEQRQKSQAGRKTAANKARRTEAWWREHIYGWEYKTFAREFLSRCIRCRLSAAEWCVLDFIFDRTVQWNKEWETLRMSQFVSGSLLDKDGYQSFCGTGLSERTVRRALKALKSVGLIKEREKANGNGLLQYAVAQVPEIEAIPAQQGHEIRYRAKWPGTDQMIAVISRNVIKPDA